MKPCHVVSTCLRLKVDVNFQAVMQKMKQDHTYLTQIEQAAANDGGGCPVLEDLKLVITPPVRLLYLACEEHCYSWQSPGGAHLLNGLLRTFSDNKLIEDVHGHLRNNAKGQNKRMTSHNIQELTTHSRALESREIPHRCKVTRPVFLRSFPHTRDRKRKRRYQARLHKLPKTWSGMMARKNWATISEATIHKSVAAFQWVTHYCRCGLGSQGVRLQHGKFSKFAMELRIMMQVNENDELLYLGFSLGSAEWGALFWPLCEFEASDGCKCYYLDPAGEAQWIFVLQPSEWHVLTHKVLLEDGRIYFLPLERVPLLKCYFEDVQCLKGMTIADMSLLNEALKLPLEDFNPKTMKRDGLLHALLDKIGDNDDAWIATVKEALQKPPKQKVIGDALDEYLLSEMALPDQRDFKEVADEVETRKKIGWSVVEQRWREANGKKPGKPKAKAKAKAKAKPKAKGAAKKAAKWVARKKMSLSLVSLWRLTWPLVTIYLLSSCNLSLLLKVNLRQQQQCQRTRLSRWLQRWSLPWIEKQQMQRGLQKQRQP